MKTIPVREVAEALGISARGVLYRREKGHLKGVLVKNERGVDEYRIYPTKEIIEGLRRLGSPLVASNEAMADFEVVDQTVVPEEDKVLDSTYGDDDIVDAIADGSKAEAVDQARGATNGVADQLWNGIISRFMEKLEAKDQLIGEMRANLSEKDRQLLLLPDHESIRLKAEEEANKVAEIQRKRAEEERLRADAEKKKVEAKEHEVEALRKQVGLLQEKISGSEAPELARQLQLEKATKQNEVEYLQAQLEDARRAKELEVKALEERLAAIDEYKRISEESQRKLDELQKALEERNAAEREKASETAAIREELLALASQLQKAQTPWWKKIFSTPVAND